MDTYIHKPVIIQAQQYTKEMYDKFVALGKRENENPIILELDFAPGIEFEWNWYSRELSRPFGMPISVGEYIVNDADGYGIMAKEYFESNYQKVSQLKSASGLNFYTHKTPEDRHIPVDGHIEITRRVRDGEKFPIEVSYTHWANGLRFVIQKGETTVELYSGEIEDLINALTELRVKQAQNDKKNEKS